jgi:hypothetical protein
MSSSDEQMKDKECALLLKMRPSSMQSAPSEVLNFNEDLYLGQVVPMGF